MVCTLYERNSNFMPFRLTLGSFFLLAFALTSPANTTYAIENDGTQMTGTVVLNDSNIVSGNISFFYTPTGGSPTTDTFTGTPASAFDFGSFTRGVFINAAGDTLSLDVALPALGTGDYRICSFPARCTFNGRPFDDSFFSSPSYSVGVDSGDLTPAATPEPSSLLLFSIGILAFVAAAKIRLCRTPGTKPPANRR